MTESKGALATVLEVVEGSKTESESEKSTTPSLSLHYPWSPEALEMLEEMDERYQNTMICDSEVCAKCMGESEVTPASIREARCYHMEDWN